MSHVSTDDLLDVMHELRVAGVPFVVATVIETQGSTPRKVGAKMVVAADGRTFGTVGGGAVEGKVIERSRALLDAPVLARLRWELASSEAGSMVCGGVMELLLEPFLTRPRAYIFGAGHVGRALNRVLGELRFDVTVVDDREALLDTDRLAGARLVHAHPREAAVSLELPPSAFAVIVTRAHTQDLETLRALVGRELRYLGVMSSRKKKLEMFERLEGEGVSGAALARVHIPIGLDIGAETPEEIAVAVAAEMVAELRREPGRTG
jgi:xanthine dehydrogenase accessory factor